MTSGSPIRRRTGWLTLAAAAAIATLLSCSDKPPIAPEQTPRIAALTGQPLAGQAPLVQSNAKLELAPRMAAVASAFTATPFAADFVVTGAESGPGAEHYFPSNGNGTFGSKSTIPGLGNVDGMDVADMDGDGDNDFLACDGSSGEAHLYTNNGLGSFTPAMVATAVSSAGFCTNLRIADFNEDGRNDFVVGDEDFTNGLFIYLQSAVGTFTKVPPGLDVATWNSGSDVIFGVAAGDVDRDGHQDVVVLGYFGEGHGQVRFYKGTGTGAMGASVLLFNLDSDFRTSASVGLALFDLETDGDLDIVAGGGGGDHYVYTNNGSGSFTKPAGPAFDVDGQSGVDAFDVDGDGDHDLLVATFGPSTLYLVKNNGGSLAAPVSVSALDGASLGVGAPPAPSSVIETTEEVPKGQAATVEVEEECTSEPDGTCDVAGVDIPAGTTDQDVIVTVRLEQLPEGEFCHDYLMAQHGRCLEIDIKNKNGTGDATLLKPIVAGLCLPSHLPYELYKFEERDQPPRPLRQVAANFLECEGFETSSAKPSNWLEGLAMGLTKRVGKWITPKSAYAADMGFGGFVDDGHTSFFTWASPIQVTRAGYGINVFRGQDVFGVEGVFGLEAKGFDPDRTDAGFTPPLDPVTVRFGESSQTIVGPFTLRNGRWTYFSAVGMVNYLDIHPTTGQFRVAGRIPTEGGRLPIDKPFTLRLDDRIRGGRLLCGANGVCSLHH